MPSEVADILKAPHPSTSSIIENARDKQRLQNGVAIVSELIEGTTAPDAENASASVKKEQKIVEISSFIDLTLDDDDDTTESPEVSSEKALNLPIIPECTGQANDLAVASEIQSPSSTRSAEKRPAEDKPSPSTPKRMHLETPSLHNVEETGDEDNLSYTIIPNDRDGHSPQENSEESANECEHQLQLVDTSDACTVQPANSEDLCTTPTEGITELPNDVSKQKPTPKLNDLHLEVIYHKCSSSGEHICRLCL